MPKLLLRHTVLDIARSFMIVAASVVLVSFVSHAAMPDPSGGQYTIVAGVQPARYIVVDNNLQISQIISNTASDVVPYVVLNSVDGSQVPYTDSVHDQYVGLKPTIDFSRAGIVYQQQSDNALLSAVQATIARVRRFIFG